MEPNEEHTIRHKRFGCASQQHPRIAEIAMERWIAVSSVPMFCLFFVCLFIYQIMMERKSFFRDARHCNNDVFAVAPAIVRWFVHAIQFRFAFCKIAIKQPRLSTCLASRSSIFFVYLSRTTISHARIYTTVKLTNEIRNEIIKHFLHTFFSVYCVVCRVNFRCYYFLWLFRCCKIDSYRKRTKTGRNFIFDHK